MARAFRLGEGQGGAPGLERTQRLFAAALLFHPQRAHEVRDPLAEPGARRLHPRVRQRVGQNPLQLLRGRLVQARRQHGAGLEGRVLRVGQVNQRELRAWPQSQPALQEGRHRGGSLGPALHGHVILGEGPGGQVGAGVWLADGDHQAGRLEAQGCAVHQGRGHAGHLLALIESAGFRGGQRHGVPVDERHGGRLAMGKLDRQS